MKSNIDKPIITFAIVAYNQERFIREAIEGAFSQTYSPLEIILSDDCSTDHTFEIIKELADAYQGPHTIILNRNDKNLGIGAHFNRVMELARGDLVVGSAGDDISVPYRVERIYQAYESTKGIAKSIFSNYLTIDISGKPLCLHYETPMQSEDFSPNKLVKKDSLISGCSHAWSREVFSVFGPLITPLTCEDMVIPLRSALIGQIKYINEPLVMHRQHGINIWNYKWHHKTKININREIEFTRFWLYEKKAIYMNWIKDLQIMGKISNSREEELRCLQAIVYNRLLDIEEYIFMLKAKFTEKAIIVAKHIFKKGMKFQIIRHEIGFFLIPKIFRMYMIVKNKISDLRGLNDTGV